MPSGDPARDGRAESKEHTRAAVACTVSHACRVPPPGAQRSVVQQAAKAAQHATNQRGGGGRRGGSAAARGTTQTHGFGDALHGGEPHGEGDRTPKVIGVPAASKAGSIAAMLAHALRRDDHATMQFANSRGILKALKVTGQAVHLASQPMMEYAVCRAPSALMVH
jgi:hypothetical protein